MKLEEEPYKSLSDILVPGEWVKSRKGGETTEYLNLALSFDIEVSSFMMETGVDSKGNPIEEKCACMYAYVLGIDGKTKIGRTWEEFLEDIGEIIMYYETSLKRRIIIYVHNLSYEFQFIRKLMPWRDVFAVEQRKVLYALHPAGIEFRCSYRLSNMNLEHVGKNLVSYPVKKMVGDLDYAKTRNSVTPLTKKEIGYIVHDALVVMAYIQELIDNNGGIQKLPLTSTGFVRLHCRSNCLSREAAPYRSLMKKLTLTPETYSLFKLAYQGGFTHANAFHSGIEMRNVSSFDFTSSYPTVLCCEEYPMSAPEPVRNLTLKGFKRALGKFACVFKATFGRLESTHLYEHYISVSKCVTHIHAELDNGRVVSADELSIYLTELDFEIISKTYKWESLKIERFHIMLKEYLPKPFVECILDFYEGKTTLKGVKGKEYEYLKSKEKLNSCYGMCVTDPCKERGKYGDDGLWRSAKPDLEGTLNAYNASHSRFLYYAWGVWCAAYARRNLWSGIIAMGNDYIYSDTDSLKIINVEKHRDYFEKYDRMITSKMDCALMDRGIDPERSRPKTKDGIVKQMGVWDEETKDGTYDRFKTLGAKRYLTSKKGKIELTVAGVGKKAGSAYLKRKWPNLDDLFAHFEDGLVFPGAYLTEDGEVECASGKKTLTYIDEKRSGIVTDYLGNEAPFEEMSAIHMGECDYEMSLSQIYKDYLLGIKEAYQ